jgi:primosomal protein N' (replication factor Y)
VIAALLSGDLQSFLAQEAAQRRPGHWPPFGRLAALIVSALDERLADQAARALFRAAPRGQGIEVLGPAPAPFALLRGRYRRRLLLKTAKEIAVQPILRNWLARADIPKAARVDVDVDPVSFM